ncbi:hypothetical protein K8R04_04670 [Candidatus Uhrbacteria bacterium]|nr:hypothetical protein [Candidatus Uhrbacteria bacterium]
MAKKSSFTKSLETAQKNAVRELTNTRKRIRSQSHVSSYEYGILHEDTVAEAKKAADLIDTFIAQMSLRTGPTLVLMREREDVEHLVLAVVDAGGIDLLPNGHWKMDCRKFIVWNDAGHPLLQNMETKGQETLELKMPMHRLLGSSKAFIVCGDKDVAKRLLPSKEKSDGDSTPRDRFNFFYSLTQKLGYAFHNEPLQKRVIEERERVAAECRQHLKSLEGVLNEFFFQGPREPYHNFKGDASPLLIRRAKGLADEMRDSIVECRLYGVDTEESRELLAFGTKWVFQFKFGL